MLCAATGHGFLVPPTRTLPNAENCTLAELETAIKCAAHKRSSHRLLAIKSLIMEFPFEAVAKLFSVSTKTLSRWVGHFNEYGIDGLIEKERSGRPARIDRQKAPTLVEALEDPSRAGYEHWTGRKYHGYIQQQLGIELGYTTVIRFMHQHGYCLKVPQPWPDRQDELLRKAFCERLLELSSDQSVELWFGDETGIEGDPRPRRRWAVKGTNPRVTKNGDHVRMNICGIVAPRTGKSVLVQMTHSDTDCFQCFLDIANQTDLGERPRQILIVDNASWHKSKSLTWGRFEPMFLPPYSPDLNPIEKLWRHMKAEWFTDFIAKDRDALMDRIDRACQWVFARQEQTQKTCPIKTEL